MQQSTYIMPSIVAIVAITAITIVALATITVVAIYFTEKKVITQFKAKTEKDNKKTEADLVIQASEQNLEIENKKNDR